MRAHTHMYVYRRYVYACMNAKDNPPGRNNCKRNVFHLFLHMYVTCAFFHCKHFTAVLSALSCDDVRLKGGPLRVGRQRAMVMTAYT